MQLSFKPTAVYPHRDAFPGSDLSIFPAVKFSTQQLPLTVWRVRRVLFKQWVVATSKAGPFIEVNPKSDDLAPVLEETFNDVLSLDLFSAWLLARELEDCLVEASVAVEKWLDLWPRSLPTAEEIGILEEQENKLVRGQVHVSYQPLL